MPRAKPDQVVVHRIEMGGWEREQVKDVKSAVVGVGVAVSAAALASAVALAVTAYATFWSLKKLYGWGEEALDAAQGTWKWYWGEEYPPTKATMWALEKLGLMKKWYDPETESASGGVPDYYNPETGEWVEGVEGEPTDVGAMVGGLLYGSDWDPETEPLPDWVSQQA